MLQSLTPSLTHWGAYTCTHFCRGAFGSTLGGGGNVGTAPLWEPSAASPNGGDEL